MAWLLDWIPTLILAVWFGIGVARDSRRFGLGILLVLTIGSAIVTGLAQLGEALSDGSEAETMAVAIALVIGPTMAATRRAASASSSAAPNHSIKRLSSVRVRSAASCSVSSDRRDSNAARHWASINAVANIGDMSMANGLYTESMAAALAQSSDEANKRMQDFLNRKKG